MYKQINKIVLRKIIYSNFKIEALTNNQARNSQVCNTKMTGFGHEHLLFERQMHWKWEREREIFWLWKGSKKITFKKTPFVE